MKKSKNKKVKDHSFFGINSNEYKSVLQQLHDIKFSRMSDACSKFSCDFMIERDQGKLEQREEI